MSATHRSPADRRLLYASSLAHLADDLIAVDFDDPNQRHRLSEIASDVSDMANLLFALAEEVG